MHLHCHFQVINLTPTHFITTPPYSAKRFHSLSPSIDQSNSLDFLARRKCNCLRVSSYHLFLYPYTFWSYSILRTILQPPGFHPQYSFYFQLCAQAIMNYVTEICHRRSLFDPETNHAHFRQSTLTWQRTPQHSHCCCFGAWHNLQWNHQLRTGFGCVFLVHLRSWRFHYSSSWDICAMCHHYQQRMCRYFQGCQPECSLWSAH